MINKSIFCPVVLLLIILLSVPVIAQSSSNTIDYSKRSNILNPDTLLGDNKAIFYHFIKLTSREVKDMKAMRIKEEFGKLGLSTDEKDRFIKAYSFFVNRMEGHKVSCENWKSFEDLAPK